MVLMNYYVNIEINKICFHLFENLTLKKECPAKLIVIFIYTLYYA